MAISDVGSIDGIAGNRPALSSRLLSALHTGASWLAGWLAYLLLLLPLWFVWDIRDEGHLSAESGLGYWLGIAGASAMLLLLTYPLRKRWRFLDRFGAVPGWFRVHMYLGLLGPVLIVAHSNFHLGSLNSSVALFSMLMVSISGLAGRYFYSRIHFGLYGARATLKDLQKALEDESSQLGEIFALAPELQQKLMGFAAQALSPSPNVFAAAGRVMTIGVRARFARMAAASTISRKIREKAARRNWPSSVRREAISEARSLLADFFGTVRRTAQLGFFERLFALWHVLHIPLFYMLVFAAIIHVYAVHVY